MNAKRSRPPKLGTRRILYSRKLAISASSAQFVLVMAGNSQTEASQNTDVLRTPRQVIAVDRERLKRLGRLMGRVRVPELFILGGTLLAACLLFGGRRHLAPPWAHKWFLTAKES